MIQRPVSHAPWKPDCALFPSGVVYPVSQRKLEDSDALVFRNLVGETITTREQRDMYLSFYCMVAIQTTAAILRAKTKL